MTLDEILFSKIDNIQNERKTRLKTLDNILNKITVGSQGGEIFNINEKIINLNNPLLTESSKQGLDNLFGTPIDPDDRTTKNVIKMMIEDGVIMAIPGGRDGYINFLTPFLTNYQKRKTIILIILKTMYYEKKLRKTSI